MAEKLIDKRIQEMIENPDINTNEIINYVHDQCQTEHLQPKTLGMIFETYAFRKYATERYDPNDPRLFFSDEITIKELKDIHPDFQSANGCHWARSDQGYLGAKYIIKRKQLKGKVVSIRLDGSNKNSIKKCRTIRSDIKNNLKSKRCVILDISKNVEIDHKNGKYNELSQTSLSKQKEYEFQPLSKAANDAKRKHCKECNKTRKRYDAKRLGYKEGWIAGDENTPTCEGCYWYDPKKFNEIISKDFDKKR